jgi:NitT/TauT family transport system ATP-binding protein
MLEFDRVTKTFAGTNGCGVEAIRSISLCVQDREFVAFVGPSGCGKTSLLKLIAGLEKPTQGRILFEGREVVLPGHDRGMVFQEFALFPWLSVRDNIAFGLRLRKRDNDRIQSTVSRYLKLTGLEQFKDSYPHTLSGGMQQRVAIARTLANNPKILLLDEPFGALDMQTRSQMQEFLSVLWEHEHKTVLLVTHDIEEALFLADRVYVLSPRPTTIRREFKIAFARPRIREVKFSRDFLEMKREISELL